MGNTNDFDNMITTHNMKLIKTALPYIDISEQRFLSIYLKFSEFVNTIHLFSEKPSALSACKSAGPQEGNVLELVNALKTVCDDTERETLDMMLNFMQAMQLYKTYSEFYKASGEFQPNPEDTAFNFKNMDVLKTFLSPEQQTMFETYKSLF
ncbi:MAG: hypothetical protein IJA36_05955 [Lachnospiraceae bacterium]|nr:hypothetical protein [Lachnospiraceae bacterium]